MEITVPRRLRSIPDGPRVHYSTDCTVFDWSFVGPMPVASVTRTILDLAGAGASLDVLERVYECGQRRGETSFAALEEIVDRLARPGKQGIPHMRALLERVPRDGRVNASEAETRFFQILRDHRLPLPTRQHMVERADGSLAFADYAYEGIPVLLEVLGLAWHSSSEQLRRDAERRNALRPLGYSTIEFTWHHLTRDRDYVVRLVRALLRDNNREYRG
ncbi:MAG TPA: DUF559 domain-containing protein [Acidimicrobiales bacterium]